MSVDEHGRGEYAKLPARHRKDFSQFTDYFLKLRREGHRLGHQYRIAERSEYDAMYTTAKRRAKIHPELSIAMKCADLIGEMDNLIETPRFEDDLDILSFRADLLDAMETFAERYKAKEELDHYKALTREPV